MTEPLRITSPGNERVKALVRLRGKRERDKRGLFIIEESLVIQRALAAGHPLTEVWACPAQLETAAAALYGELVAAGASPIEVTATVMAKIAYRDRSDGLLVVAPRQHRQLTDLVPPNQHPPLLLVLESVEKPGNLGAALRIADGAGVDALIVCGGVDLDNPNCLRASRGAFFTVPTVVTEPDELLAWLGAQGITVLAASPAGAEFWDRCDLTGPTALVLGAEDKGLSSAWLAAADAAVSLPMLGSGDSLNLSTAAAVLLYEAVRQRRTFRKAKER